MLLTLRATLLAFVPVALSVAQTAGIPGHYEGTLKAQNREVNVTVDLDRNAKQAWIGHIILSPNPAELPLENITLNGDQISWTVPAIPGAPKFDGRWDREAKTLNLTAHIGGMDLPVEVRRTAEARVWVPEPNAVLTKDFEGKWEGAIDTGAQTLRLTLTLDRNAEGRADGVLVSVDQGGVKIPIGEIKIAGNEISFAAKAVNGTYKGRLNPEKNQISGDWTQFGNTMPLNLKREAAPKQ